MNDNRENPPTFTCPAPLATTDRILLGHGSGGKLSADLIRDIFLPAFQNPVLARLDDQAIVTVNGTRLAFTTDSFVVSPLFFRGGDIGSLAVHGTINDLAMGGAQPLFLSAAFIIEEGLTVDTLRRVVASLHGAAKAAGVEIVTGDTKVVERGSGDELFILSVPIHTGNFERSLREVRQVVRVQAKIAAELLRRLILAVCPVSDGMGGKLDDLSHSN